MFKPFLIHVNEKFNIKWITGIVMVILILVFCFKPFSKNDLDTYDDPKLAFESFSKSMKMISTKYNQGASSLKYLNEVDNTVYLVFKKTKHK